MASVEKFNFRSRHNEVYIKNVAKTTFFEKMRKNTCVNPL